MRIWLKWTGFLLLTPVVFLLLAAGLLYVPAVQNVVAKRVVSSISASVGWEIGFERVHLAFPLNLSIHHACIKGGDNDTMAYISRLVVDVRLKPLMKGHISVRKFNLTTLELNTGSLLDGMVIQGKVGKISLSADSINLAAERIELNQINVSNGNINLYMSNERDSLTDQHSAAEMLNDTINSAINLFIGSKMIELKNVAFACRMPDDSVFVDAQVEKATLSNVCADLNAMQYSVSGFHAKINALSYSTDEDEPAPGFDVAHVQLKDVFLASDSLYYDSSGTIYAMIRECSAKERSGLFIKSMTGAVVIDSLQMEIPSLAIETAYSSLKLQAIVPWVSLQSALGERKSLGEHTGSPLQFSILNSQFSINKKDVLLFLSGDYLKNYPDEALRVEASVYGDLSEITVEKFEAEQPGAFSINVTGAVCSFDDELHRAGRVDYAIRTQDLGFVAQMLTEMLQTRFQIPDSLSLEGYLTMDKGLYTTETTFKESDGHICLSGSYDVISNNYEIDVKIDSLEPIHFMPDDSLLWVSTSIYAKGQGTDPYHPATQAEIKGAINDIRYKNSSLTDIIFSGSLKKHQVQAEIKSAYPLINGSLTVDGTLQKDRLNGMLIVDVDSLDFHRLSLVDSPLSTSFQLFSEFETDLEKKHKLDVTLGNWKLNIDSQTIQPKMVTLAFRSDFDTTHITFYAGDMSLIISGNSDLETLTDRLLVLSKEAEAQLKRDSVIDIQELYPYFPELSARIHADRDNPVSQFLQDFNTYFDHFELEAALSPEAGLTLNSKLLGFYKDTLRIDTVRLDMWMDTYGLWYAAGVTKNRFRNQDPFRLSCSGYLRRNETDLFISYLNSKGENGLYLGVNATKMSDGYNFRFYPEKPVLAYLPFTINANNYFYFKDLNDIDANVRLRGDSGASIRIHTEHMDEDTNELTVEIERLNLEELSGKFASLPALKGLLNVTCRYMPVDNTFKVIADGAIDELYYERSRIGELLLKASWLPTGKSAHQLDLHAFHDLNEIITLSALYQEEKNKIDGVFKINRFPLQPFNAMLPAQTVRMAGFVNAKLDITGSLETPELNGDIKMENVSAYAYPAATTIYFDDQTVKFTKNRLLLEKYKIYTQKDNPMILEGVVDVTNTSSPVVNLRVSGSNLQLFDSRRTAESLVFGRMFLNINANLTGTVQALRMRGNMRVLGNSNFTYIMPDSPLDVEDNFSDLVLFTYFADSIPRRTDRPLFLMRRTGNVAATAGVDMLMTVNIDPVVRFRIDLDESNYVEMRGGGDLSLQYTTQNDLRLNGRYTLSEGSIRYAIPVIPLTDFSIRNGSYVDWSGDPFNPYLNILAYTRARSSVNVNGQSQMVDFNTGISLRDNLNDVSIQFLLEAPTNALIQNQLTSMGAEERSKQAISLLVTGVYLASEGEGKHNLDVGAALSSLLQREVKNILGNMLGDVPVTFDVNTYDGTKGMGRRIDYIGRFYKDFFNERFNTTVGLRFSTADPKFGNKFFPEDISLGYRLDMDGSRSIQFFRNREYENTFEGEIVKYGAGFTIRKKVKHLKDLFVNPKK